jgi:hypothetical protein
MTTELKAYAKAELTATLKKKRLGALAEFQTGSFRVQND